MASCLAALFGELASHVDMATEEGRASFVAHARPLLRADWAPALARCPQALRRLVFSPEEVDQLVPARAPERRASAPAPRVARKGPQRSESRVLAIVLHRTELAGQVPEDVLVGAGPEAAAARAVVGLLHKDPALNLAQVSAYFEGSEHEASIEEEASTPPLKQADSPDFDLEAELRGAVDRFRSDLRARRRTELMGLVQTGTATPEQHAEFNRLLTQLSASKSGNQSSEERSKI